MSENEEWEEIDPQEVELILKTLEELESKLKTETLVAHLQEAAAQIEALVDWEEDDQADAA